MLGSAFPAGSAIPDDPDGVLVGPDGAIGAKAIDDRSELIVGLGAEGVVDRQGAVGDVVVDADREMVARCLPTQFIEHGLHHRWGELLRGQSVTPADQPGRGSRPPPRPSPRPGFLDRVDHIEVKRFTAAARFLATVQHRNRPHAGRQGGHQPLDAERPEQPHLEHTHSLTSGIEGINRFVGGFTA